MKNTFKSMTMALAMILVAGAVAAQAQEIAPKAQTTCPVMGGKVSERFVDVDGNRIYVCCSGCVDVIKNDPQKYIAKIKANGETVAKTPSAVAAKSCCPKTQAKACDMTKKGCTPEKMKAMGCTPEQIKACSKLETNAVTTDAAKSTCASQKRLGCGMRPQGSCKGFAPAPAAAEE